MSIEIIPAGASAVVSERHHERHESRHPDRWDLSTEMQRDLNHMRSQAEKEFVEASNQAERNQAADVVRSAKTDSKVAGSELNTQKGMDYGFRETMLRGDTHYEKSQKQVSDAATSTVVGFKDAAATAYQLQGQSLLEAAKNAAAISVQGQKDTDGLFVQAVSNFNAAAVQASANFNALSVQGNLMQYNILLDSQKNAAAGALLATQIAATAAAAAAECCCELKEKIGSDGQKTRDLLNSITEQNLRDRAQRSETALAAYFSAKVAPVVPVSA